ncbi:MAG TPA: cupin domain-containing protein [Jiangellaceae bacterium]
MTRNFEEPDKTTRFPNGYEHVIDVLGTPVGLATFQPGWRWSNDVRPLMGTDSCPLVHVGYVLSGRLHVRMNDGSTLDLEAGELCVIPSGQDAWVVGDEVCRLLGWGGKVPQHAPPVDQSMGGTR